MKIFFWQNTNSIHQSSFLKALSREPGYHVTLIVTEMLSEHRLKMGWIEPELPGVKIERVTGGASWQSIISNNRDEECIHIFSGIAAFPLVHEAFKLAIKYKCRIGILSEPLDERGWKGKLRMIRGVIHRLQYKSHISLILAISKKAKSQFLRWGFDEKIIFEWAYTVEQHEIVFEENKNRPFKIIFVGSLIMRKGYDLLIEALKLISRKDFQANFFCIKDENEDFAESLHVNSGLGPKLRFLRFLENSKVQDEMASHDLLILPSRHDGWGAVVSESLMVGTPVLISEFCGASSLITEKSSIGMVISNYSPEGIAKNIESFMESGQTTLAIRTQIQKWASDCISGHALSSFFTEIISFLNEKSSSAKPLAPWLRMEPK